MPTDREAKLEQALLEYIERFGLTEVAREFYTDRSSTPCTKMSDEEDVSTLSSARECDHAPRSNSDLRAMLEKLVQLILDMETRDADTSAILELAARVLQQETDPQERG